MPRKRELQACKDSSSSSDNDLSARDLREATDTQFLSESLFRRSDGAEEDPPQSSTNAEHESLRRNVQQLDQFQEFGITQSFKKFVAKKLGQVLDREVAEDDDEVNNLALSIPKRTKKNNKRKIGIKLLQSSNLVLTDECEECGEKKGRYRRVEMKENTASRRKFQEAAVDPEWILSKASVKAWTNVTKGVMFNYKRLKNGVLVECD